MALNDRVPPEPASTPAAELPSTPPRRANRKALIVGLIVLGVVALGTGGFVASRRSAAPGNANGPIVIEVNPPAAHDGGVAAVTPPAHQEIANPNGDAKLYLDEAQRLVAEQKWEAAAEPLRKAQAQRVDDAAITIRMSQIADDIAVGPAREEMKRAWDSKDRATAIAAAGRVLERKPDDPLASEILTAAQALKGPPVAAPPPATTGTLTVKTRAGALIFVDGELVGRGQILRRPVAKGNHEVLVKAAGFTPSKNPVTVTPRTDTAIAVTLTPAVVAVVPPRDPPKDPLKDPTPPPTDLLVRDRSANITPAGHGSGSGAGSGSASTPAADIAPPRLPGAYTAHTVNELTQMLAVIENEAIDRGGAPASVRGVTSQMVDDVTPLFAPGTLIEIHPGAMYYDIVKLARAGRSTGSIGAMIRKSYTQSKPAP